jgi:hypothetical protein
MPESLAQVVLDYEAAMRAIVKSAVERGAEEGAGVDWTPLEEFVAVGEFERVGTWMEVSDWARYTAFLTQWASASGGFETVIRRVSELPGGTGGRSPGGQQPGLVYLEVEERHTRPGGTVDVVNSLSVYEFNDEGKIRHLDVYLQQPR